MIQRAWRRKPGVALASPVGQPPSSAQAPSSSGPAAEKIAPHTPPPRARPELAAFTIASTASRVMSPRVASSVAATDSEPRGRRYRPETDDSDGLGDISLCATG